MRGGNLVVCLSRNIPICRNSSQLIFQTAACMAMHPNASSLNLTNYPQKQFVSILA
jgi:hypothetical protein